jgi:WG containing repeat
MKFFALGLVFLFPLFGFSQVQVVRDPLACAYGLKNEQGKWVVAAEYQQLLSLDPGIYACQQGEKWGILRANGKKILATKYDNVSVYNPGRYVVSERIATDNYSMQKMGILDSSGIWILPQEFCSIGRMENEHFMLMKSSYSSKTGVSFQTSIADAKGQLLFPYLDGVLLARFRLSEVNLIGNSMIGSHTVSGNVRLVNSSGKIISDSTYDMGMPCGENFIVTKKGKYGLVNSEGRVLVEPRYSFEKENYDYTNPLFCLHGDHEFIFVEYGTNGSKDVKRGILNGQWKETVPARYERITPLNSNSFPYAKGRYVAYQAETRKYHLIDDQAAVLVEADTFMLRMIPIPKKDYYEVQKYQVLYLFGQRIEKGFLYGILNGNGAVLLEAEYETIIINDHSELVLLRENRGTEKPKGYTLSLNLSEKSEKTPLTFLERTGNLYLFSSAEKIYPLNYSESCQCWEQSLYGANMPKKYGNYTLMTGNEGGILYNHKINSVERVKYIDMHSGYYPSVQTDKGVNLLHPTKGFLFKQPQQQINHQFSTNNRIWSQLENGKWKIYDTLGNLRIAEEFDAISYFWDTMVVQQNFKKGLMSPELNWITKPLFADIFQVTKRHYIGLTASGRVALLDMTKPKVIDTSYTSYRPIFQDASSKNFVYCLEKNGQSYFFDANGTRLNSTEKDLLARYWSEPNRVGRDFFIESKFEEKGSLLAAKDLVYQHFYSYYLMNLQHNHYSVSNGVRGASGEAPYLFKLEHGNSQHLSLLIHKPSRNMSLDDYEGKHFRSSMEGDVFEMSNFIFQNGSWKKVEFKELFNPKNGSYQKAIIEAIQNAPDLKIDCHEPTALYEGATQFSFQKDGIKLYFFPGQPQTFEIVLNRKQLESIPSAKWVLGWL